MHFYSMETGMGLLFGLELFIFFIAAGLFILWVWALIDIITSRFREDLMQVVWLLVVFFLPVLGLLIYLLVGRTMRKERGESEEMTDKYGHLSKLKSLLDEGVITQEEFNAEKQKILNS